MHELVDSYALGSLDEGERRAFETHLSGCPLCQARLDAAARAAAALPFALADASPLRPPAALRARVMDRVTGQKAAARPMPWLPGLAAPRWPTWRAAGAVAAAAVLALSLVWTAQLGVALARERALREELALELAQVSDQREIVLEVVDARDKTTRMLRPVPGAPREFATSYGKVYTRPDMPYVVAMTGRIPAAPSGQAYHLWLRLDGQTRLAGVLKINAEGFEQLVFRADRLGPAYESVWLTLQPIAPAGTTPTPGATLLRWDPS